MPALKNDKFREYTRYAEYCLNMVASTRDQELRCAAEDAVRAFRIVGKPRRRLRCGVGTVRAYFESCGALVRIRRQRKSAERDKQGLRGNSVCNNNSD